MKSILIIEDEILVARSTEAMLSNFGYQITGIATNAQKARTLLLQHKVDLILCDINLNEDRNGIDLMREIKEKYLIPFIFISSYSDRYTLELADQLHPHSYLTKPFNEKQLLASVNRVFLNAPEKQEEPTQRELLIISLISKGMSSKIIGKKLNISFNTVESHRKNMLKKFAVNSTPELICLATSKGWVSFEA